MNLKGVKLKLKKYLDKKIPDSIYPKLFFHTFKKQLRKSKNQKITHLYILMIYHT